MSFIVGIGSSSRPTSSGWVSEDTVTVVFDDDQTNHLTIDEARDLAQQLIETADEAQAGQKGEL